MQFRLNLFVGFCIVTVVTAAMSLWVPAVISAVFALVLYRQWREDRAVWDALVRAEKLANDQRRDHELFLRMAERRRAEACTPRSTWARQYKRADAERRAA